MLPRAQVSVFAQGASASNTVGCRAITVGPDLSVYGTSYKYLAWFGPTQELEFTTSNIANGGALFAYCIVNPGGQINSVRFYDSGSDDR